MDTILIGQFRVLHLGEISQYEGIRVVLKYQDGHVTNAKHRPVYGSSQLKPQKTNCSRIQLFRKLLNASCLLYN